MMFPMADCLMPAADLAARIRQRQVSPVAVIDQLNERIKALDPKLNAYITLDLEGARKEAEFKETMLKQHPAADLGPLHGVPVAVKDDLPVKGLLYTIGSRLCTNKAEYDDITVQRLRKAGAIILGKTSEPEFGHKGVTDNNLGPDGALRTTVTPWDITRTSGGSSGGSAAAVAAGLSYLALGTDIAGSVRIPASCCGVVGLKPTFGVIPRIPSGNAFSLWVSGPLGRTVADVALAMNVLAGPHPGDRFSYPLPTDAFDLSRPLPKILIRWCADPTGIKPEPDVEALVQKALDDLIRHSKGTFRMERAAAFLSQEEAQVLVGKLKTWFAAGALGEFLYATRIKTLKEYTAKAHLMSPTFRDFVTPAWETMLRDFAAAQEAITTFCEEKAPSFWGEADLIATPTLVVVPFNKELPLGPDRVNQLKIDPHLSWANTWPFNLTGEPAVSLPCGWTRAGLPVGLQLVGRRGQDGLVLRVAAEIEKLVKRPPLPASLEKLIKPMTR